ncbi:hypothetical protein QCA50_004477 [Cerrena zonata]|uniref:Rho-GAP domain-containing protein n=1 Tax=Cerrena zonata TaxID=2478898 RepID=A0AAW0GJK8_9APHY
MGLFTKKDKSASSCDAPKPKPNKLTKKKQDASTTPVPPTMPSSTSSTSAARGILRKPSSTFYTRDSISSNATACEIPVALQPKNKGKGKESGTRTQPHAAHITPPNHRASEPNINASKNNYPDRLRFASLPTDHLPSTNENPYPAMPRPSTCSTTTTLNGTVDEQKKAKKSKKDKHKIPEGRFRYHSQTLDFEVFKAPQYDSSVAARHEEFFVSTEPEWVPLANYAPRPNFLPQETDVRSLTAYPFLDLGLVTRSLKQALKKEGKRIEDYLEVDDIVALKCWETDEVEGLKDCTKFRGRKHAIAQAERDWRRKERQFHVFGASLKIIERKATTWVPIFGFMHRVPKVAVACIERLYANGMDTPDLFHQKPNGVRLTSLICQFDSFDPNAPLPDLSEESPAMVAALLSTFIGSIQGPIIHRTYFDALWAWVVQPTIARETEYRQKLRIQLIEGDDGEIESASEDDEYEEEIVLGAHGLPSFNSRKQKRRRAEKAKERAKRREIRAANPELAKKNRHEARVSKRKFLEHETFVFETHQVAVTRFVLMCLPPHTFSFMMYVFTFLAELPKHPDNGVRYDTLSDMYAWKLLGGPNRSSCEAVMRWLLSRWWRVVEGFKSDEVKAEEERLLQKRAAEFGAEDEEFERLCRGEDLVKTPGSEIEPLTQSPLPMEEDTGYFDKAHTKTPSTQFEEKELYNPYENWSNSSPTSTIPPAHFPEPPQTPTQPETPKVEIGEDTTVISPFKIEDEGYATDDEEEEAFEKTTRTARLAKAISVVSEWAPPQREAFSAIKDLLHTEQEIQPLTPGCETDGMSVYSQDVRPRTAYDDDVTVESFIDEYIASRTPLLSRRATRTSVLRVADEPSELKKQLQEALDERDRAQKRIEAMQKKFESGLELR